MFLTVKLEAEQFKNNLSYTFTAVLNISTEGWEEEEEEEGGMCEGDSVYVCASFSSLGEALGKCCACYKQRSRIAVRGPMGSHP